MTRKQIAFRIDGEKANQLKEKIEDEGKSLNTVLERLVDAYLEGKLTDDNTKVTSDNSELTSGDGSAIEQLTHKINQLEKQLTPVTELLAVTATDKEKRSPTTGNHNKFGFAVQSALSSVSSKVTSVTTNDEATGDNSKLTDGNNGDELTDGNADDELTDVSSSDELASVTSVLTDVGSEQMVTGVNADDELTSVTSKLTDGNSKLTDGNSKLTDGNSKQMVTPVNADDELTGVSSEVTDGNSSDELAGVTSELTSVTSENNISHEEESAIATGEGSPIETGEETSNDNVTKDDNDEPETAPNPENLETSSEITPSESTLETAKDTHQDESLLKPPEALELAKIEEYLSDWMNPKDFVKILGTRLGKDILTKTLTDRFSNVRKRGNLLKSPEGNSIFSFYGLNIERKQANKKENLYRLIKIAEIPS